MYINTQNLRAAVCMTRLSPNELWRQRRTHPHKTSCFKPPRKQLIAFVSLTQAADLLWESGGSCAVLEQCGISKDAHPHMHRQRCLKRQPCLEDPSTQMSNPSRHCLAGYSCVSLAAAKNSLSSQPVRTALPRNSHQGSPVTWLSGRTTKKPLCGQTISLKAHEEENPLSVPLWSEWVKEEIVQSLSSVPWELAQS